MSNAEGTNTEPDVETVSGAEPVEFNPNEVEKSEDDGTTRTEGFDAEDKVVEK